jgi:hypothetical protein
VKQTRSSFLKDFAARWRPAQEGGRVMTTKVTDKHCRRWTSRACAQRRHDAQRLCATPIVRSARQTRAGDFSDARPAGLSPYEARNYAFKSTISLQVRWLAGAVDQNGKPMRGYVLRQNSCINGQEYLLFFADIRGAGNQCGHREQRDGLLIL